MRRKSTRNAQKLTPDKLAKDTESPKTRRSKRRKRTAESSESEDESFTASKHGEAEETPDTTTKSHTPSDDEASEEPMWKVTSSEEAPQGEIQKLKLCLTRPPDSPDKSKNRRNKSSSQTEDDATSSEDKSSTTTRRTRSRGSPLVRNDGLSSQEEDVEDKKGKGKSKGKHKSKIEKSPHVSEPEIKTNNEISENVQVTPQSPSIDKPVDNESDYNKVDDDVKNVNEKQGNNGEESATNDNHNSDISQDNVKNLPGDNAKDSDDDEPLSVVQKNISAQQHDIVAELATEDVTKAEDQEMSEVTTSIEIQQKVVPSETPETQAQLEPEISDEKQELTTDNSNNEVVEPQPSVQTEEILPEKVEEPLQAEEPQKEEDQQQSSVAEEQQSEAEPQHSIVEEEHGNPEGPESVAKESENSDEGPKSITEEPENSIEEPKNSAEEPKNSAEEPENSAEGPENLAEGPQSKTEEEHSSVENVPNEEVKENNSAHGLKSNRVRLESETVSETQGSPSRTLETSFIEEVQEDKERPPRRRLKRSNISAPPDSTKNEETRIEETTGIKPYIKKRKWEADSSLKSSLIKIDLESLQVVWPSIDFPEEPDLNLDVEKERRKSITTESSGKKLERKVSIEYKSDSSEKPTYEKQTSVSSVTQDTEDNSNIIAFNRKISIVDDTASKLRPPPSPAKNPTSDVLYITNLVRPFTLKQLKELLERTGKIQEEGFWTDRIKSKCYVQYETVEEAEATRNALHGVQWPIGNGKKLIIDYATVEDLKNAQNPPPAPVVAPAPDVKAAVKENVEPVESKRRSEEKASKEVEKKIEGPVREWDIGKKDVRRERSRSRERSRKHRRSPTPSDDFISRKQRKTEESVPQKLMDDLFLKTKATPSIYWQPLSPEEISMKQQQRLMRMEEHKRRMEENSRMKGREMGRGAFRRRYD